ncbi:MAG: DUF6146 family protein [Prevotella sp.]|nr:DUF6146 family protein [Prevotella sp.]
MNKQSITFLFLMLFALQMAYSQVPAVRGQITSTEDKRVLPAVMISNTSRQIKSVSDSKGNYTIRAGMGDTLRFSLIGFKIKQIVVSSPVCDIALDTDKHVMDKTDPESVYSLIEKREDNIYLVDGNVISKDSLLRIDPSTIESISILKDGDMHPINKPVTISIKLKPIYEAIVMESGYETFLVTQRPKNFYTESSLKTKNVFLVNEWNYRCDNPMLYSPLIYEAKIDYNPQNEYGLDVEYRLYMFFRYMDKKYRLGLENW